LKEMSRSLNLIYLQLAIFRSIYVSIFEIFSSTALKNLVCLEVYSEACRSQAALI